MPFSLITLYCLSDGNFRGCRESLGIEYLHIQFLLMTKYQEGNCSQNWPSISNSSKNSKFSEICSVLLMYHLPDFLGRFAQNTLQIQSLRKRNTCSIQKRMRNIFAERTSKRYEIDGCKDK